MQKGSEQSTKRDEILDVASRLFYEQGYNKTGVQQIIAEAGAAKGTFYSHFKSKEDLGIAWLKARHITWNSWLNDAIRSKRSARAKIVGIFDFLGRWMADCDYRGCAFINTLCEMPDGDAALREEIANHKNGLRQLFQTLAAEHHSNLPKQETDLLGSTMFLLFEGSLVEMQNFREQWPVDAAKLQLESML